MAHMMMDGGGSGGASGDGLIDPSQFPCRSADFSQDRILASATAVSGIGDNVFAAVENTQTAWNGLQSPGVYEAPEQDAVYTLIQPAVDEAQTFRDGLGRVSQALSTYADELAAIQPALRDLEERAAAFRAEALAGYEVNNYEAHGWFAYIGWADMGPLAQAESQGTTLDPMGKTTIGWREHGPAVEKNEELLTEYGELLERISTAAANCANTINAELNMCVAPVVPFDAEGFLQTDDPMPFGAPMEEDRNCSESVGHGFQTFVGDTIHGIVGLVGFDENWQHSWEYAGQTWANNGDFLFSTLIMLNPQLWLGSMGNQMLGHGTEYDAWIMERVNLGFGGWSSLIGYDHFAALDGENGWHRWEEDGWATFTESGLGIGTMFLGGSGLLRQLLLRGGRLTPDAPHLRPNAPGNRTPDGTPQTPGSGPLLRLDTDDDNPIFNPDALTRDDPPHTPLTENPVLPRDRDTHTDETGHPDDGNNSGRDDTDHGRSDTDGRTDPDSPNDPDTPRSPISPEDQSRIDRYERLLDRRNPDGTPYYPDHLRRMFEGEIFNLENHHRYPMNEVHVTKPGSDPADTGYASPNQRSYNRIDSIRFGEGGLEVVERKHTQLGDVSDRTLDNILKEIDTKYGLDRRDIVMADTPTNRTSLTDAGVDPDRYIGRPLSGRSALEVPVQDGPPPLDFLKKAADRRIRVVDVDGTRWSVSADGRSVVEIRADGTDIVHPPAEGVL